MMFASVDSQQTCCEHAMNMFGGRAVLPRNETKIVGFQDEHKGIPCRRMLVRPSRGGSFCHKHFFSNSRTSCSWLLRRLCRRTRSIVCTVLNNTTSAYSSQCRYFAIASKKYYASRLQTTVTCVDEQACCNFHRTVQCYTDVTQCSYIMQ